MRLNLDNIKVLIFDFGGVIINLSRERSVEQFKDLGVYDADKLLDNYVQSGLFLDLESGKISPDEFRNRLRANYHLKDISDEKIDSTFIAFLLDVPDYKLDLLRKLHIGIYNKQGDKIRVVLLSNTNGIHFPYCVKKFFEKNEHSINEYFDRLYLSYQMKMSKPDKDIFIELLRQEQVNADECLFLDDSPANISTANTIGFHTCKVDKREDLSKLFNI